MPTFIKAKHWNGIGQTNINNCRVSELNKQNIKCISPNKIVSKFDAKLYIYRILFKDIPTIEF